jgi:hypothetical protein
MERKKLVEEMDIPEPDIRTTTLDSVIERPRSRAVYPRGRSHKFSFFRSFEPFIDSHHDERISYDQSHREGSSFLPL